MKITESGIQLKDGVGSFTITKTKEGIKTLKNSWLSNFSISNITGTSFVIDARKNQTSLKVLEGTVEIYSTASGICNMLSSGESITSSNDGFSEKTNFNIDSENSYWDKLQSGIEKNPGVLNSISNFLANLQNKLNDSEISNTFILVIGIGIIFLIIALIILILFLIKIKAR